MIAPEWWPSVGLGLTSVAALGMVWWVYDGYGRLLALLASRRPGTSVGGDDPPAVTVLLTVHNEERAIETRLSNLLESDYPTDRLSVVVASDRSTDRTNRIVDSWSRRDARIRLLAFESSRGKSDAQNRALESIDDPLVVFTDADTRFAPDCLRRLVAPFEDPLVGGADAELEFEGGDGVAASFSRYWSYERRIRMLESRLGVLAVASGACVAVRRRLVRPLPLDVGEDCVLPLMVVSQGRRMVVATGASAWDRAAPDAGREYRARVRMTLRNWRGTWAYPSLLNPVRRPGIALALWSHKVLRWLGLLPLAVGGTAGLLAIAAAPTLGLPYAAAAAVAALLLVATPWPGRPIRHLLMANLAFAVGVAKAVTGRRVTEYRADSSGRDVAATAPAKELGGP